MTYKAIGYKITVKYFLFNYIKVVRYLEAKEENWRQLVVLLLKTFCYVRACFVVETTLSDHYFSVINT
jgi:hypothetical protein